jgi:hypothetical protein
VGMVVFTDYIHDAIYANIVDTINNSSMVAGRQHWYSEPWQPPIYTDLRFTMFLNLALIALAGALAIAIAWVCKDFI